MRLRVYRSDAEAVNFPIIGERDIFGRRSFLGWRTNEGLAVLRTEKTVADDIIRSLHYSHAVVWASNLHFEVQYLSMALRLVRHLRPKVEWVQSFADERCEKFGAVYQAASFLYCGEHSATFYELDGEWFHKSAWNRAAIDKRGWGSGPKLARFNANRERAVAHAFRQFRYIKFLRATAKRKLLLPVLPYPKANSGFAAVLGSPRTEQG